MAERNNTINTAARLVQVGKVRTLPGVCTRLRGGAECRECADACPLNLPFSSADAVLTDDSLEACINCGACSSACPTEAIRLGRGQYERLLRATQSEPSVDVTLVVACSAAGDTEADMSVPCLRAWDGSLALAAWSAGHEVVELLTGECSVCTAGGSSTPFVWLDHAQSLGAVFNRRCAITWRVNDASSQREYSGQETNDRRAFLTSMRDKLVDAIASEGQMREDGGVDETERGVGSDPPRRAVSVACARRLEALDEPAAKAASVLAPGSLCTMAPSAVGASCDFCGDCATYCPVSAMRVRHKEDSVRLSVDVGRCVGCGVCITLCRQQALAMKDRGLRALTRTTRLLLHDGDASTCDTCGTLFGRSMSPSDEHEPHDLKLCGACRRAAERFPGMY